MKAITANPHACRRDSLYGGMLRTASCRHELNHAFYMYFSLCLEIEVFMPINVTVGARRLEDCNCSYEILIIVM
jgi:hypothetical protein